MDANKARLVQESYQQVLALQGTKLTEAFYERLFRMFPEMKMAFRATDMERQHRMLFDAIAMVVESLHSPESLQDPLADLGKLHARRFVRPEYYARFGKALVETLGEFMGDQWTPALEEAWSELYADTVSLMIGDIDVEEGT